MRALVLVLFLSGCGGTEVTVYNRDGGVEQQTLPPEKGSPLFPFDVSFVGLECATIYCLKTDHTVCYCAAGLQCMEEAHDAGWPARGCDAFPWPPVPDVYNLHFGYGFPAP